jgi:signal peptidase I
MSFGVLELDVRFRLLRLAVVGAALSAAAALSPVRLGIVDGASMEPTLHAGQPFLYEAMSRSGRVTPAEVVLVRIGSQTCVKRVLAVGGEIFWAVGPNTGDLPGCYLVSGKRAARAWTRRFPEFHARAVRVPPGHIFVMGDGLTSYDSRHAGPVPSASVLGRVVVSKDKSAASLLKWAQLPPVPKRGHS